MADPGNVRVTISPCNNNRQRRCRRRVLSSRPEKGLRIGCFDPGNHSACVQTQGEADLAGLELEARVPSGVILGCWGFLSFAWLKPIWLFSLISWPSGQEVVVPALDAHQHFLLPSLSVVNPQVGLHVVFSLTTGSLHQLCHVEESLQLFRPHNCQCVSFGLSSMAHSWRCFGTSPSVDIKLLLVSPDK